MQTDGQTEGEPRDGVSPEVHRIEEPPSDLEYKSPAIDPINPDDRLEDPDEDPREDDIDPDGNEPPE